MSRPAITPRGEEKAYYDALGEGELRYGWCASCERAHFYPRTVCPHCYSDEVDSRVSAGRGAIYTYTTQYRAGHPSLAESVPYTVVMVDMAEGYRMMADLVGVEPDTATIGQAVVAEIDRDGEYPIVHFRPAGGEAGE